MGAGSGHEARGYNMFLTLTLANGPKVGTQIEIVVDKVFGLCYSDTIKATLVMSDSGHGVPVKEDIDTIKASILKAKDGQYLTKINAAIKL